MKKPTKKIRYSIDISETAYKKLAKKAIDLDTKVKLMTEEYIEELAKKIK